MLGMNHKLTKTLKLHTGAATMNEQATVSRGSCKYVLPFDKEDLDKSKEASSQVDSQALDGKGCVACLPLVMRPWTFETGETSNQMQKFEPYFLLRDPVGR